MTTPHNAGELAEALATFFSRRADAYGLQQPSGKYLTVREELSPEMLLRHTTGSVTVGIYLLTVDNKIYSDNLSQETKKGKNERKARGLYNGMLPFGVMKGPDGLPKPHDETWYVKDKKGNIKEERTPTYPGLLLAFPLAGQGEADKAIAQALNAQGYRTHGTQGSNPFSKDTVGGILANRFYIGELPDSNGEWII